MRGAMGWLTSLGLKEAKSGGQPRGFTGILAGANHTDKGCQDDRRFFLSSHHRRIAPLMAQEMKMTIPPLIAPQSTRLLRARQAILQCGFD